MNENILSTSGAPWPMVTALDIAGILEGLEGPGLHPGWPHPRPPLSVWDPLSLFLTWRCYSVPCMVAVHNLLIN